MGHFPFANAMPPANAAQGSADIDQAKATLEMSRQDLQTVIVNRGALEADVENAKAALELAQIDLQNTRIVAPRDGQLGQIAVRLGAYVTAGTHLTTLVPPSTGLLPISKRPSSRSCASVSR